MKAAKEKMIWLKLVAVSFLFCAPTIALGLDVLTLQTRAELSAEYGQIDSGISAFGTAIHAEKYDSSRELASKSSVAPKITGLTSELAEAAVSKVGRIDHAGRHLSDDGVIAGNQGTKAFREAMRNATKSVLENPIKTFDHVMKSGGQQVKGYYGVNEPELLRSYGTRTVTHELS